MSTYDGQRQLTRTSCLALSVADVGENPGPALANTDAGQKEGGVRAMLTGVLGEAQDRVLGRHVGAVPGHRAVRRHGAHVDDGAPRHAPLRVPRAHGPGLLRLHRVDLGPHAVEHAVAVDAHHAVEVVETLVREVAPRRC